ncbi:uncharacterized protein LOC117170255 [Belonocnema kinseyi]|uniref:uncharacterized protein LOC117170255 n=1 Tax=Belonocnema kinseyi TaxID=2817044 RepID=UPI00143D7A10|nr:uncharacterized protein LOC117170255 [Belonocnema kinseyi]
MMKFITLALLAVSVGFSACLFDKLKQFKLKDYALEYFNVQGKNFHENCPEEKKMSKSDRLATVTKNIIDMKLAKSELDKDPSNKDKQKAVEDTAAKVANLVLPCAKANQLKEAVNFYQSKDEKKKE